MLEQLLKLYTMYMVTGVTSPMPHFVGPPGSGKSTVFQQLADLVGHKLHVVNVSRISPLGLEGLEMPDEKNNSLRLLISELWTKADDGDIYLFDEFLRGFPEVYNGLLDIFTAREVAGYSLKRVFIAGASNSTATYDPALEDRLLHLPVPDPRKNGKVRDDLAKLLIKEIGLLPNMVNAPTMLDLLHQDVLPMYDMLDQFTGQAKALSATSGQGTSIRKLIGQAKLRQVQTSNLRELMDENNLRATNAGKHEYVVLPTGRSAPRNYKDQATLLLESDALTPLQKQNIELNLQLIDMEQLKADAATQDQGVDDDISID